MRYLAVALVLIATPALAQQQPADPVFMQRAIQALQAQRNQAQDAQAIETARATGLSDDLAKAQARVKELEDKYEPKAATKQ